MWWLPWWGTGSWAMGRAETSPLPSPPTDVSSGFPRKADPRTQAEVGELRLAKGLVVTNSRAMTEPPASRRPPARRTEAAPGESRPTVCCWKDAPLLERGPRA